MCSVHLPNQNSQLVDYLCCFVADLQQAGDHLDTYSLVATPWGTQRKDRGSSACDWTSSQYIKRSIQRGHRSNWSGNVRSHLQALQMSHIRFARIRAWWGWLTRAIACEKYCLASWRNDHNSCTFCCEWIAAKTVEAIEALLPWNLCQPDLLAKSTAHQKACRWARSAFVMVFPADLIKLSEGRTTDSIR